MRTHIGFEPLRPSLIPHCGGSCSESALTEWQRQLPNALTLARVLAIPPFVAAFCSPVAARRAVPAALFAILSVTDFADGYLARRWEVQTEFGAFLDPVADKLLVCTALILLSATLGLCVALPAIVIICREVAVSGLREYARPLVLPACSCRHSDAPLALPCFSRPTNCTMPPRFIHFRSSSPYCAL
jgi:phosphatidylglycerophosphate synthase